MFLSESPSTIFFIWYFTYKGFHGTGRPVVPLSRDKKVSLSLVPLSRDKKVLPVPVSLCPGTRAGANVPGQTPLSRDVPGQNELKNFKKMTKFPVFGHHFYVSVHRFPILNQLFLELCFPILERPLLLWPVLFRVPTQIIVVGNHSVHCRLICLVGGVFGCKPW